MWLKMIGGATVVISCSIIGFIIADNFKYRPKTLRDLQVALSMLETEINYGHSTLPEALRSISRKCEKDVDGFTACEAWEKALNKFYSNSYITKNDYEILIAFGKYLGFTDKKDQIKNIKLTVDNLKQQEILALEEKQKNEKLWKYLGILSGLMIFLLLY